MQRLTDLTQELKEATDIQAKHNVTKKVKSDEMFSFMNKDSSRDDITNSVTNKTEEESLLQQYQRNGTVKDEIEELKKIFYEFFVDDKGTEYKLLYAGPKYYKKSKNHTKISLEMLETTDGGGQGASGQGMSLNDLLNLSHADGEGSTPLNDTVVSIGEF